MTHTDSLLSPLLSRNKAFHDNVQSCNFFLENHVQRCDTTTVAGILVTQKKVTKACNLISQTFLLFTIWYHLKSKYFQKEWFYETSLAKVIFITKVNVNLTQPKVKQLASKWSVQISILTSTNSVKLLTYQNDVNVFRWK